MIKWGKRRRLKKWNKLKSKPDINSKTLKIVKSSKSLYDRQKEFLQNKKVHYEIRRKEEDDKIMKDFTGAPEINEKSRKMSRSNISKLLKSTQCHPQLLQPKRTKSAFIKPKLSQEEVRPLSYSPKSIPSTPMSTKTYEVLPL